MTVNNGDELDRKQRRGRLYDDNNTFVALDRNNIINNIDNNNGNDDFKKQVFEEIFLSGSMPNVTRVLSEQFIDFVEGNCKDYKLLPYVLSFFIDIILRGIAQVFLCNHPITGIFILIGLGITSIELVGYALLGAIFGNIGAALIGRPPMHDITSGLCGYDAALVGCASWAFLSDFSCRALIAAILSFISGIVHVACANILNVFDLPTFTLAFNITMICFLLSVSTNHAKVITLRKSSSIISDSYTDMSIDFFVDASIKGVGQFMFVDTTVGSSLVIFGIAISSRIGAFAAWTGSTVACLTAYYLLQVEDLVNVRNGLFGYNSSGCVASLSGNVFFYSNIPNFFSGSVIGGSFAVLILTTFQSIFGTLWDLPVLTFPFITTTWLMMMTRSTLFVSLSEPDPNNLMLSSSHHSHHSFEKIKI